MDAYQLAYDYVQHTNRCIFLTGKAGTGKTTFLRRLKQECPKQLTVVAPTGVAAINAEGVTIHSLFQLPPQLFLPTPQARQQLFAEMQIRAQKQRVLRNLELLVIDEVSMVRADLLDAIDAVLRHFKHQPNIPFGGVQVLFIGDLFQLSPVAREAEWRILQEFYTGPYFFQAQVFRDVQPVYIELDHVFRQTNAEFVEILNQVRNNTLTPNSLQVLNTRFNPHPSTVNTNELPIVLSTHNAKVDAINQREMEALSAKKYTFRATIKDTFPESLYPMDEQLTLCLGARVMFIKNDSSQDKRYYNGKIGTITHITPKTITVTCNREDPIDVHMETWEHIRYISDTGSDNVKTEVVGSFSHYPLRLAWAITIHKAQGLTFDNVIIDAEDAFAAGQIYVALSRCRSLDGLVLRTRIPSRALTNARDVIEFSARQTDIETTQRLLPMAQQEYLTILCCALYDFREIIKRLFAISRAVNKMISVQSLSDGYFTDIITTLEDLQSVGDRFQQQIRQLIYQNNVNHLQERLRAASTYYATKIYQVLKAISDCPLRTNDKSDASYIHQHLVDIFASLSRKAFLQSQIASQPTVEGYFMARSKFHLTEPNLQIYTQKRKVRTSGTAFQTLTLLKQGYRLSEIADMRNITLKTIVRHLRPFLDDGVINISDIYPADRKLLR